MSIKEPQKADPKVIVILEGDSAASMMIMSPDWSDVYDITVVPVMTGEEGMARTPQMMQ